MAGEPDNIILEHLRQIRAVIDKIDRRTEKLEAEVIEIKSRITSFEATMGHVMAQIGHLQAQIASQTRRIDSIEAASTTSNAASILCRCPPRNSRVWQPGQRVPFSTHLK
jgi:prefoldin subunit 5